MNNFINKLKSYRRSPLSLALFLLMWLAAMVMLFILVYLIGYILIKGIPNIKPELFEWKYDTANVSMMPAIINTLIMTAFTLAIAAPVGIFAAVYMVEYAKKGNRFVKVVSVTTETLSGIPSICFGLFGMLLFVYGLKWEYSMLAGILTLAIMVLPTIIRTTQEALLAVPDSYREGSFGLGAGKLRTVFKIILPSAIQGIIAGVILAIGRIVGESAALIFTAGTGTKVTLNPMNPARTLSVHMYCLLNEGLYTKQAYATAVVLLVVVIFINILSGWVAKRVKNAQGSGTARNGKGSKSNG